MHHVTSVRQVKDEGGGEGGFSSWETVSGGSKKWEAKERALRIQEGITGYQESIQRPRDLVGPIVNDREETEADIQESRRPHSERSHARVPPAHPHPASSPPSSRAESRDSGPTGAR